MADSTMVLAEKAGKLYEFSSYQYYDQELQKQGFKYLDAYNPAFSQHRNWAETFKSDFYRRN